jgi:hypothetical protein
MKSRNEIDALVSLLDDPDEIIFNQIKSQLLELGTDCIAHLEKANFENEYGQIFKSRISEITHEISLSKILKEHKEWIHHPVNLIDGVNQIDQYFFPNITESYIQNELSTIASEISEHLSLSMSPIEKVSVINDILYDNYNFRGDKKNYHSPENSSFGKLLQTKKGNPLTNSILYIEIGRLLNLPIMGVNLPNHFIVGYLNSKENHQYPNNYKFTKKDVKFYINPFSQGVVLKHEDVQDFVQEINVINNEYYYIPCSYSHITKRILTNLNFSYKKSDNILLKNDIKKIIALYH